MNCDHSSARPIPNNLQQVFPSTSSEVGNFESATPLTIATPAPSGPAYRTYPGMPTIHSFRAFPAAAPSSIFCSSHPSLLVPLQIPVGTHTCSDPFTNSPNDRPSPFTNLAGDHNNVRHNNILALLFHTELRNN